MKKYLLLLALMLFVATPLNRAWAVGSPQAGIISQDVPEKQDRTKDFACDCCQKCKAAKSTIKPKNEDKALDPDGCDDCCGKCGKALQPTQQETPPEIIQKNPPDIIDKSKK